MKGISWRKSLACILALACHGALARPSAEKELTARLSSCDPQVVRAASLEVLRSPERQGSGVLFVAAHALQRLGEREDAAFISLATLLRSQRHGVFARGDAAQVTGMYSGFLSGTMMPFIESDPAFAESVVRRVVEWDRATPDENRDRPEARIPENAAKLADIDATLRHLPDELRGDPDRVSRARQRKAASERTIADNFAMRCGPGKVDPAHIPAAEERIKREAAAFIDSHPEVRDRARNLPREVHVTSSVGDGAGGLPKKLVLAVSPRSAARFYADVGVRLVVNERRELVSVAFALDCLSDTWQRGDAEDARRNGCDGQPAP